MRRRFYKRIFDILFSLFVLISLFPLYLALALLIKCSSRGPVFYISRRIGLGGKLIKCFKFRTMYPDADFQLQHLLASNKNFAYEWATFHKLFNDPRVTPIGRFLRKTSLDELPQFFNVLLGDLSVVGPRGIQFRGPY
ncbi:MAG: sugar transferase, partial [Chlamydiales bacterium]|nr:sugar transferase [Chlamydiales bacterium]